MIKATVIADSVSEAGKRITTFELEYPRFIHSEFLTHRAVSKNAASSRAIPVSVTIKQIQDDPAMPVFWGKNQAGMSAAEELDADSISLCKNVWTEARDAAISHVLRLVDLGLHKQIANRILEPWVNIKIVATATEWDNLFHLRRHKDAQPEFQFLANGMWDVREKSVPKVLKPGEWHLPYVDYIPKGRKQIQEALKLSASLCAQLSYRKADESIEKAIALYDRLVVSVPVHASPFEHQAKALKNKNKSSGNFKGFGQFRQMIPNNVCLDYQAHERIKVEVAI